MAFGDTVQAVQNSASSGNVTVTFSSATAGNLLVAVWARSNASSGFTIPSGWAAIQSAALAPGPNLAGVFLYKIAAGGETSLTTEFTADAGNVRALVAEIEGPFDGTPLDQSAEDESNLSSTDTSQPSGTTGTTAQADELALAAFTADSAGNVTDGRAYTNSFAEVIFGSTTDAAARAAVILAKRVLTATGTYSTTFSTTDTGDEMWGAIATFKKAVSGGITVTPSIAAAVATTSAPAAVSGSISPTPTGASSVARSTDPAAVLGSLAIEPTGAFCLASITGPTDIAGSLVLTPGSSEAIAETTAPTAQLGSLVITPGGASAIAETTDPTVNEGGNVIVTPEIAAAVALVTAPETVLGSLVVEPGGAEALAAIVDPAGILSSLTLMPAGAESQVAVVSPVVSLGSLIVIPATSAAISSISDPAVVLGSLLVVPGSSVAIAKVTDPSVITGVLKPPAGMFIHLDKGIHKEMVVP